MKTPASLLAATVVAGCSVFGGQAAPEPEYEVMFSEPPFEIRAYPPMVVASTIAQGGYDSAISTGFGRLFDYISGNNEGRREIAMTAPVVTEPEKIAMTAPVLTEPAGAERWQIAFVLPEDFTLDTAPRPSDPSVTLSEIPARRVAVVGFSWWFSEDNIEEARTRLAKWLDSRSETASGTWQAAGYNPPWTLPWLKRNEIMVAVE